MALKEDLVDWIVPALRSLGGTASVTEVCKAVWLAHESDLRHSGDLFFTWQYDIRWAAQRLRDQGLLNPANPKDRRWSLRG